MASRLTDKQKKKILADYLDTGSYNATAERNGVCGHTVKRIVSECPEFSEKLEQKKAENTADILAYMESKRNRVCDILETGLRVLPDKIENAKTASEVTTAMGTLIDKWTAIFYVFVNTYYGKTCINLKWNNCILLHMRAATGLNRVRFPGLSTPVRARIYLKKADAGRNARPKPYREKELIKFS